MSGFEVAGIVLGVMPLAIEAAKGYMRILSSVKDAQRNLRALIHDLETEQIRLETTCEVLLDGIVPPSAMDRMIRTPLGPEWKRYDDQLKLRLWTTSKRFEEQVAEMQNAAADLRARLCVERDGSVGKPPYLSLYLCCTASVTDAFFFSLQTKLTDRVAIIREMKQNAAFSLRKKDYDDVLTRIRTANSVLHDLTGQNCGLEPSRRYRSQARLITLVRGLTRGIFSALRGATSACRCANSHRAGLELEARDAVIVPTDTDNEVAKKFKFHVALSSERTLRNPGATPLTTWDSVYANLCVANDTEPAQACVLTPTIPVVAPQKSSHGAGWTKSLSFRLTRDSLSFSSSATQTLVEVSQGPLTAPATGQGDAPSPTTAQVQITELCQVVVRNPKAAAVDKYGVIADEGREFELRPVPSTHTETHTAVTLREVLSADKGSALPPLAYPDKLRVAVALVVSILHLYKTPWLPKLVTLDDILFLRDAADANASGLSGDGYRPFVARHLQDPQQGGPAPGPGPAAPPRPVNTTVLSLAALLIQLIIGKVVDALDMRGDMDMASILSKYEAGSRLGDEVVANGGVNYAEAVKWCLGTVLEVAGLEDEKFCQQFYGAVVAKLDDDAKLL